VEVGYLDEDEDSNDDKGYCFCIDLLNGKTEEPISARIS